MRKSYSDKCDICKEHEVTRIETNPDYPNDQRGYCTQCLYENGEQCEVCGDTFVEFGWHVQDSVKNGGLRP
jgi:hypothetical protein